MKTKDLKKIYAIVSLIFLAVLAISPAKDYFREWRSYQHQYNDLLMQQPRRVKPISIGIKQIWNDDLNRVDRCTSCHLGVEEKDLVGAKQPFKSHPKVYHDINEFGCSTCHDGQGLATSKDEAHDGQPFWEEPLLPEKYLEASCGKCHKENNIPEAPMLNDGRKLLKKYNCAGCHNLGNVEKDYAPSLDGIGEKTTRQWLVHWIKDPKTFRPDTKMPDFKLTQQEADLLADFLMSFKTFPGNKKLVSISSELNGEYPPEDWVGAGKAIFRKARCISCHLVDGKGGPLAPDLIKIASKAKPAWLVSYLLSPKSLQPAVKMPQYGFTRQQAEQVTAYMKSEFVDWDAPVDSLSHTPEPNFYQKGLKLFNKYNCGGCHELTGIPKVENMGPDLTDVGDRHLYQLEFGKTDIPRTLPDYIFNKLKNPRQFVATGRMPVYGFNEKDLQALTTALLAKTKKNVPQKYQVPPSVKSTFKPQGEFGRIVEKYSCFSCHVIKGRGFRLATDLTREGSLTQRDWVEKYFKVPYSMRPILTERMPNLFMPEQDIKKVVDYFDIVLRDDHIDSVRIDLHDQNLLAEGKGLFFEKYGCQACHQVAGKGGYVGPLLDFTGDRLTAGWVYSWIMNPKKYKADTIDPTAGLSDAEARALTVYLMSLKGEK